MKEAIQKAIDRGEEIYDIFLEKVFDKPRIDIKVSTPRTQTLELFAVLEKREMNDELVGAMCYEMASNLHDEQMFSENRKLFRRITTIQNL